MPQLCHILGISTDELLTGRTSEVKLVPPAQRKSLDELTLRIYVHSSDGDVVKVNIPMTLVKVCLEMEMMVNVAGNAEAIKAIDFDKILALAERGAIGKLVEVETSDGCIVEVVVE